MKRLFLAILLYCFVGIEITAFAQDSVEPLFIGEIEPNKDAWLDKKIRVEGRLSFFDRKGLKFKNSVIQFEATKDLPEFTTRPVNFVVSGQLRKRGSRYIFNVDSVENAPADADQFSRRRIRVDREIPSESYTLADWADRRAKFYQDAQLKKFAEELRLQGFRAEWNQLPSDDAHDRLALAERSILLGIPSNLREELIHEAYRISIRAAEKSPTPDWKQLATEIARDAPGAKAPLSTAPDFGKLREDYLRSPEKIYHTASPEARVSLHRVLWGEVKRRELLARAELDPTKGSELAGELQKLLPEYQAEAEKLRDDLLMKRGHDVEKLTRRELLELRDDLLARNKKMEADKIVDDWLALRKQRLSSDDLEGLLQLAAEYEALSREATVLGPSLVEAAKAYPDSREIVSALGKMGYRLVDGTWLSPADRNRDSATGHDKELREGVVDIGMTATEVRKSQGTPVALTRIVTNGELREIWSYGKAGDRGGFTVYFRRGNLDPQAKVFAIDDVTAR